MFVFLKYLVRSSFNKKGRSILLILTITISTALLIGCIGAVKSAGSVYKEEAVRAYKDNNVLITSKNTKEFPFFDLDSIQKHEFKSYIPIINASGYLSGADDVNIILTGIMEKDYSKLPNYKLLKGYLEPFNENKIIISDKVSRTFKLNINDTLRANVRGNEHVFKVVAIVETSGPFLKDNEHQFTIIANKDYIQDIWGIGDFYSGIVVQLKDDVDEKKYVQYFNLVNDECSARLVYDTEEIERIAEGMSSFFFFMLFIVIIMSCFIIYSCFKLIVLERMPVVGTFLSLGATRGRILRLLLGESLVYAIISGIMAMFLGAGVIYLLSDMGNDLKEYGIATNPNYNVGDFVGGFIFAILIAVFSAMAPIISIRKKQVKDIILNTIGTIHKNSYILLSIGLIISIISLYVNFQEGNVATNLSPLIFFSFVIGVTISLPLIVNLAITPFKYVFQEVNVLFRLALNNIRTSKVLLNNIRLLTISIVSVMLIASVSLSIVSAFLDVSQKLDYDIIVQQGNDSLRVSSIINNNLYVKEIMESYDYEYAEVVGSQETLNIKAIEPNKYINFNNYFDYTDKEELFLELDKRKSNIALSSSIARKLNKKVGDTLILKLNNREVDYKIIGIYNAKLYNNGDINLISKESIQRDFGIFVPTEYVLKGNSGADKLLNSLEKELKGTMVKIRTKEEIVQENIDNNKAFLLILLFFALATGFLGAIGIFNNIGVSFIQRKKDFAILSSLGMTSFNNGLIVLFEGIITAVLSSIVGGGVSYIAVNISNKLFKLMDIDFPVFFDFKAILIVGVAICVIMITTSLPVILKSSKLSVVKELRYE
ncbi:UNVERIFIED_CONTAM: putative ABC transport system permease protein [Acetivibrio alkalicellulosi]